MKKLSIAMTLFSICLFSACTSFQVKNTDGLRLAYEDIDLASSKGSQLKSIAHADETQRQQAIDLYVEAKKVINSYLQQTITDASVYNAVDKDAQSYKATGGSERVAAFQEKVGEIQGVTPLSVGVWMPVAIAVLTEVKKLHDQNQKTAYERFEATVNKYMMKSYEELPSSKLEK